ncbi:hypothetical protein BEWA_015010 [Theileria equi strain WA]|uniref:Uncharacterized protein n=1 Tax=Theileria equi strain WA TaxID=1537102 RepID=L1LBX0_THEEQ|nr:hypothetical protein BEWA_015010 [Theileria equi strain WA]EKX72942.1 hypothetical protein BEWA_015010 [Theileria equi strain WA]|eukprot:XP_004832394.1 hypothetical protein BEWA_015010 [Theileria equi strain WA]
MTKMDHCYTPCNGNNVGSSVKCTYSKKVQGIKKQKLAPKKSINKSETSQNGKTNDKKKGGNIIERDSSIVYDSAKFIEYIKSSYKRPQLPTNPSLYNTCPLNGLKYRNTSNPSNFGSSSLVFGRAHFKPPETSTHSSGNWKKTENIEPCFKLPSNNEIARSYLLSSGTVTIDGDDNDQSYSYIFNDFYFPNTENEYKINFTCANKRFDTVLSDIDKVSSRTRSTLFENSKANNSTPRKTSWDPKDIKMCSPFCSVKTESTQTSNKSSDGSNHSRSSQADDNPLRGIFVVSSNDNLELNVESYERLYKSELDLLLERGEIVDQSEIDEWHRQAALTEDHLRLHSVVCDRLSRVQVSWFGKRLFPVNKLVGNKENITHKSLSILVGSNDITVYNIKEFLPDYNSLDKEHIDDIFSILPNYITRIFKSKGHFDITSNTDSNEIVENFKITSRGSTKLLLRDHRTIGMNEIILQNSKLVDKRKKGLKNTKFTTLKTSDMISKNPSQDVILSLNRSFAIKVLMRFPYLDLHSLPLG